MKWNTDIEFYSHLIMYGKTNTLVCVTTINITGCSPALTLTLTQLVLKLIVKTLDDDNTSKIPADDAQTDRGRQQNVF